MVAIIGNKGSGKSALTDILSLCGNSHRYIKKDFSFLTQDRFLKYGLAKNFKAKLIWENDENIVKNLGDGIDENAPERVQYLPQKYFEKLTNDLEHYEFEETLKDIVFYHLPNAQKLNKKSFTELINFKEENVNKKIKNKLEEIQILNKKLIELDKKKHPDYKKQLDSNLNLKKKELKEHEKNKPVQVLDSSGDNSISSEQESEHEVLKTFNTQLNELEAKIEEKEKARGNLILKKEDLDNVKKGLEALQIIIDKHARKYKKKLEELNLSITDILVYEINFNLIETEI